MVNPSTSTFPLVDIFMIGLYHAHSGLRYLVLLLAIMVILSAGNGLLTRRQATKFDRVTMGIFTGLLDLQALLGVALIAMGIFYGALMGHVIMMILALAAAHATGAMARKATNDRRAHSLRLVGALLALVLIAGGIMAIGRGPLDTSIPTQTS